MMQEQLSAEQERAHTAVSSLQKELALRMDQVWGGRESGRGRVEGDVEMKWEGGRVIVSERRRWRGRGRRMKGGIMRDRSLVALASHSIESLLLFHFLSVHLTEWQW